MAPLQESFVLCSHANSFPVEYVSQGFQNLFGLDQADCLGQPCGQLLGCMNLTKYPKSMDELAVAGWKTADIVSSLEVIHENVGNFVNAVAKSEGTAVSVLSLNRKGSGEVFVCQMALRILRHPSTGWSYAAGFQEDVSDKVPVLKLLHAASEGSESYRSFLASLLLHGECCLNEDTVVESLHAVMQKRWFNAAMQQLESAPEAKLSSRAPRSVTSVSTTCSLSDQPAPSRRSVTSPGALASADFSRRPRFLDLLELPDEEGGAKGWELSQGFPVLLADLSDDAIWASHPGFRTFKMDIHGPESIFDCIRPEDAMALQELFESTRKAAFSSPFELVFESLIKTVGTCLVHLMQIELEDTMFIVGVFCPSKKNKQALHEELSSRMDLVISVLASKYFLTAPLRRQLAQRSCP